MALHRHKQEIRTPFLTADAKPQGPALRFPNALFGITPLAQRPFMRDLQGTNHQSEA
jgi:hypothetical protein